MSRFPPGDREPPAPHASGTAPDLARLERWIAAGGEWVAVDRSATGVTIALTSCDRGEEMDRIVSTDPAVIEFVSRHEDPH